MLARDEPALLRPGGVACYGCKPLASISGYAAQRKVIEPICNIIVLLSGLAIDLRIERYDGVPNYVEVLAPGWRRPAPWSSGPQRRRVGRHVPQSPPPSPSPLDPSDA